MTGLPEHHQERAQKLMRIDPFEVAKRLVGEEHMGGVAWLINQQLLTERKASLSELCDTYYRMPWAEAVEIFEDEGFEVVQRSLNKNGDEAIIAAERDMKLLLTGQSSTNLEDEPILDYSLTLNGQIDDHDDWPTIKAMLELDGGRNPFQGTLNAVNYYPVDGFRMHMAAMRHLRDMGAEFIDWVNRPETSVPFLDYDHALSHEINVARQAEIWASLPDWVRSFTKH